MVLFFGRLTRLPSCLLVSILGVPIDVLAITIVALAKSPYMLLRGWHRLLYDLIGREGPFLETVCVPFAGLAILLWPLAVTGAVIAAVICSFFLGLYGVVIVYEAQKILSQEKEIESTISSPKTAKLEFNQSRTLRKAIQQLKPIQIWDWLFRSCKLNGRILLNEGLISIVDIEESVIKGNSKKLSIRLPAWCILQCLVRSARIDANGLLISDGVELTSFSWPKDKVLEWLFGPLLIMKEQIKGLHLEEDEESCLRNLIMTNKNERPEDWENKFPSDDMVRRAQVQAILRRLQGIVASLSRMPTFRRRFNNLVKDLYVYAIETDKLLEKYSTARIQLDELKSRGCTLLHGINVKDMHEDSFLKAQRFDRIIFNFPHAGHYQGLPEIFEEVILMHKKLLCDFFSSARSLLSENGEIHVSHRCDYPYNSWGITGSAEERGLILKETVGFQKEDYPGYENKRGGDIRSNETFSLGNRSFTFKFSLSKDLEDNDI